MKLRETAINCGLLPRILERLGAISGEKARVYEDEKEEEEKKTVVVEQKEIITGGTASTTAAVKKKRMGVGYSSKVGQTFNVTEYLENKKVRNEQIKNLVDICTNFLMSKEWKADERMLEALLQSPLLPLLENSFRNGSWLEMAKEN